MVKQLGVYATGGRKGGGQFRQLVEVSLVVYGLG
jgi:hypothetical protein